jgi:5-hydroxyisourate hydrolase
VARLSTHVLDTSRGGPAEGVAIDVYFWGAGDRCEHLKSVATNADGRTDEPLLAGDSLRTGIYEIRFHAGKYFRQMETPMPDPPFLDEITVRFGIADAGGNYHIPLLVSPYSYTTYRGS